MVNTLAAIKALQTFKIRDDDKRGDWPFRKQIEATGKHAAADINIVAPGPVLFAGPEVPGKKETKNHEQQNRSFRNPRC